MKKYAALRPKMLNDFFNFDKLNMQGTSVTAAVFLKTVKKIEQRTATIQEKALVAKTMAQRLSLFNRLTNELEGALEEDKKIRAVRRLIKKIPKK